MRAVLQVNGKGFDYDWPLGDGPAKLVGGGATFAETPRPERTSITDFTGNPLIRIDVPIFFDGFRQDRSIEGHINQVLGLTRGDDDGTPPPDFTARGPIPYSGLRYVMELPDWGDGDLNRRGEIVRQALTLHLVQWVDPASRVVDRRKRMGISQAKSLGRVITLGHAETLIQIAGRFLHDPSRAPEIGALNGIRDVRKRLPAGTKVRLPDAG
jgi:hypothetical protein